MNTRKGNAVSLGIAIGPIYCYTPFEPNVAERHISGEGGEPEREVAAYERAAAAAAEELRRKMDSFSPEEADKRSIIKAHIDILEDCALEEEIRNMIEEELLPADLAILRSFDIFHSILSASKDELLRERAADLMDVRNRLLRCCAGEEETDLSHLTQPVILAARELFPSDTASLDRKNILGFVTEQGGSTSHTAILAKSYEIPAVLGVEGLLQQVTSGQQVILDAVSGVLLTEPTQEALEKYSGLRERFLEERKQTKRFLSAQARMRDGTQIQVKLNVGSAKPEELEYAPYADGVGLFRTEFLYMGEAQLPTEEAQFAVYRKLVESVGDKPVILRTLDIGGDKKLPCLPLPEEPNPFLGKRALRLCLEQTELFRVQLRAALRASAYGKLWIMFPMVGSMEDFRRAKEFLLACGRELRQEGVPVAEELPIGAMIEIPAIALLADKLAEEADFVSIGTNDLTQYLTAADRMNQSVAEYYQSYHPAVFRTIGMIADAFAARGKMVSICGELGGDPLATPVLLGLGIHSLSMAPSSLAGVKKTICQVEPEQARALAARVLQADTAAAVEAQLREWRDTAPAAEI